MQCWILILKTCQKIFLDRKTPYSLIMKEILLILLSNSDIEVWLKFKTSFMLEIHLQDFPGSAVVKNLPANTGGKQTQSLVQDSHVVGQLSPRTTTEAHVLQSPSSRKRSHSSEKPTPHNHRLALRSPQPEKACRRKKKKKACRQQRRPSAAKKQRKKNLNTSLSVYKQNDTIPEIYFKILQQKKGVNGTRKAEY